jgi:hypothetical protein
MILVPVKRMPAIAVATIVFLLASLSFSFHLTYASESSCVKCHTSEIQLKALHKPVKVPVEKGEG